MARIVTVFSPWRTHFKLKDMAFIRWLKISEALARLGHEVDIAVDEPRRLGWWFRRPLTMSDNLRRVPLKGIDFSQYDVVKCLFHIGFRTVVEHGGGEHPFIVAKLGSVVGSSDMPGIYFYGKTRSSAFRVQCEMARRARYITVLSEPARDLWLQQVCAESRILLVPGAVDREIPDRSDDPYPDADSRRCLFSGNIYSEHSQPEAHATLVDKLNDLGGHLLERGFRLYVQGTGDAARLDPQHVSHLGSADYRDSWQAMLFADVGIVVSAGAFMHNNESTKIYHYLRAGLPVVSESGFPNDHVLTASGLGSLVDGEDMELMADRIAEAGSGDWDREQAIQYILEKHTWDQRAKIYDGVIREHFGHGEKANGK